MVMNKGKRVSSYFRAWIIMAAAISFGGAYTAVGLPLGGHGKMNRAMGNV